MHILIIEDEEQLCRSMAEGLRMDGYETDTCFDGEEGLELCMTENYDLILLDLNLPGIDGLEILVSSVPSIPILLFSYSPQEYRFRIRWKVWIWEPTITLPSHFISRSWRPESAASPTVNLSRRMSA